MKYGGIHYDYGRLTIIFFLILVTLQSAAQQDSVFIQDIYNGQSTKLACISLRNEVGLNTLVRDQWTGINRAPNSKSMSFNRLLKIESKDTGLNCINKTYVRIYKPICRAESAYKAILTPNRILTFSVKLFSTPQKESLKICHLFLYQINDFAFALNFLPDFLKNIVIGEFSNERKCKMGLFITKLHENIYSYYYRDHNITKRTAPTEINISREKLAIRACDLVRFLTISFLTTKKENSKTPTETICNNCCIVVDYDDFTPLWGSGWNSDKKKKGGLPMKNAC